MSAPILVIQTAFVGDVILTLPLLKAVRKHHPQAPIHMLVRRPLADFITKTGLVDRVWDVDKQNSGEWRQVTETIKQQKYLCVYCPHQSIRSALLVWQITSKHKIGYKSWWNRWAFDVRVPRPMELTEVSRLLALIPAEQAACTEFTTQYVHNLNSKTASDFIQKPVPSGLSLYVEALTKVKIPIEIETTLKSRRQWIALAPGSVWATKRWIDVGWVGLALKLTQNEFGIIWVGSETERALCMDLKEQVKSSVPQLVTAGHLSLAETASLLSQTVCVFANDSGVMHLAGAVGAPVIGIFGPTAPTLGYIPWTIPSKVAQIDLPCRPCGKHGHNQCPIGTHACMKGVTVEHVMSLFEELHLS